jgi:hypothetical protein
VIANWYNSGFQEHNVVSFNSIFSSFVNSFGKSVTTEFKFENMKEGDLMTTD